MKLLSKSLLVAVAMGLSAGAALAAPLTLETTFDLTTRGNGPDTPGLDGASVRFLANFADGTLFTSDAYALPRAVADSVVVEITGASVAGTNGSYTPTRTLGLFPGSNDGYLTSGSATFFLSPDADATFFGIGDLVNQVRLSAGGTVPTAAVGDPLTLSLLQSVDIGAGGVLLFSKSGPGGTGYDMSNFSTTAYVTNAPAPVPLPAALPMLGAAFGGLAMLRRRKASA